MHISLSEGLQNRWQEPPGAFLSLLYLPTLPVRQLEKENKQAISRAQAKTAPVTNIPHTAHRLPCLPVGSNNSFIHHPMCKIPSREPQGGGVGHHWAKGLHILPPKGKHRIWNSSCGFYPVWEIRALFLSCSSALQPPSPTGLPSVCLVLTYNGWASKKSH